MATYVISDIHGYYYRMLDVLKQANFDQNKDELYVLGDIIDRGPHSGEMCKWALDNKDNPHIHFLLGNHEDMMLSVFHFYDNWRSDSDSSIWARNGGARTYFDLTEMLDPQDTKDFLAFVRTWPLYYDINVNDRRFLFVHAGLAVHGVRFSDPRYEFGRQDEVEIEGFEPQWAQSLLWIRDNWYYGITDIPCDVVFGHTPTDYIYNSLVWFEEDLAALEETHGIRLEGKCGEILHLNRKKHAIDTGREKMGLLRLDDMKEFYSEIEEKDEDSD